MVSVKQINYFKVTGIFFAFIFFIFLFYDYQYQQKQQQQQLSLIHAKQIDALIFGGSNAMNSLSARQLSTITKQNWHNASIAGELGSNFLYDQFILNVASSNNNIKAVVYSSIFPYSFNSISNYVGGQSNDGFKIIPSKSISRYLKIYFDKYIYEIEVQMDEIINDEMIFNSFGDYTNQTKNCFYNNEINRFDPESIENSTNFLVNKSFFLATNFPNSKIYIILPSLYYPSQPRNFSNYTTELKESFNNLLFLKHPKITKRVALIIQPLYPSRDYVCNDPHHSTAIGRVWRTNDLLGSINDLGN